MCVRCYKKMGRTKMAWLCKHTDRTHYARGKCQSCYLSSYLKVGRFTHHQENGSKRNRGKLVVSQKPPEDVASNGGGEFISGLATNSLLKVRPAAQFPVKDEE